MILMAGRAAASFVAVMFAVVLVAMVHAWPGAEPAPIAADIPSRAPAPTDGDWLHYGYADAWRHALLAARADHA